MTAAGFDIKPGVHPIAPVMLYDAPLAQKFAAAAARGRHLRDRLLLPGGAARARRASARRSARRTRANTWIARSMRSCASGASWASSRPDGVSVAARARRLPQSSAGASAPFARSPSSSDADRDAHQAQHVEIERRQQPADLAVAAFVEHDLQPRGAFACAQQRRGFRAQAFAIDRRCRRRARASSVVVGSADRPARGSACRGRSPDR